VFRAVFTAPTRLNEQVEFTVGQLQLRAASTSGSALYLISELKLWDAEILLRTVAESSLKLTFICIGDESEQQARTDEFLVVLPEIARLKRHRRAEELIHRVADVHPEQWRPITDVLLSPEEYQALNARYPKARRDSIEKRSGFARIAEELGRSGKQFQDLVAMMYSYGMGSHAVHQDGDAILMMWEREQRGEERIRAVEQAHGARGISDVVTFAYLRARVAYVAADLNPKPVQEVADRWKPLMRELDQAYASFREVEYLPTTASTATPAFAGLAPEGQPIIRRDDRR
jgi:hypothetical protein